MFPEHDRTELGRRWRSCRSPMYRLTVCHILRQHLMLRLILFAGSAGDVSPPRSADHALPEKVSSTMDALFTNMMGFSSLDIGSSTTVAWSNSRRRRMPAL